MQYIGQVKVSFKDKKGQKREGVCPGYLDIWAGLLLKGRAVLPLARKLCSSAHPRFFSQNLLEESVIPGLTPELALSLPKGQAGKPWLRWPGRPFWWPSLLGRGDATPAAASCNGQETDGRQALGLRASARRLREAIFLDYTDHRKQWLAALQDTT